MKTKTMMDDTQKIILLTIILRKRRKIYRTRTYYTLTYYTKTSTQPPLAQSSENTPRRH